MEDHRFTGRIVPFCLKYSFTVHWDSLPVQWPVEPLLVLGQWTHCGHCGGAKSSQVNLSVMTSLAIQSRLSSSCKPSPADLGPLRYLHRLYYLHWGRSSFHEEVPAVTSASVRMPCSQTCKSQTTTHIEKQMCVQCTHRTACVCVRVYAYSYSMWQHTEVL